ncbi:MAG: sporulation protein Cse60 [Candidatus Hodarchaeales archaeon]|jgi:hypothetical protein
MITQVELFDENSLLKLRDKINHFIKKNKGKITIKDIKYNVIPKLEPKDASDVYCSTLIIYEIDEREKVSAADEVTMDDLDALLKS